MIVTFDVFTKKTKLYYIAEVITILTILVIAIGGIYNVQFKTPLMPLIDTLLILGSLVTVSFLSVIGTGWLRTYVKDGELVLADDYIIVDGTKISINETKNIILKVGIRSRKRGGNILSNRIEVVDKNSVNYKNRFVIGSYDDNEEFEKVLNQWRTTGITFNISYHGI